MLSKIIWPKYDNSYQFNHPKTSNAKTSLLKKFYYPSSYSIEKENLVTTVYNIYGWMDIEYASQVQWFGSTVWIKL
jgi:hypothetical protein